MSPGINKGAGLVVKQATKKQKLPSSEIGAMIRKQRGAMKMTVAQLAELVGVSRNTITNYESDKTEPSASDLVRLSNALGCRVEEFLGIVAATDPPRFAFRAHASLKKEPSIIVSTRRFLRAYSEIEEITEAVLCDRLQPYVFETNGPLKDRELEGLADDLRQGCGLHDCGPENIASVLEGLGVRCLFFNFDAPGLDGISAIQGDLKLTMLKDSNKNVERIIFSGAHELGHLVLHPFLFTASDIDPETTRDFEKEANKFAGYFLVPSNELVRVWREERLDRLPPFHALLILKRVFHVSYWCLFYRLRDLGLIDYDYPRFINHTKKFMSINGKVKIEELEPEPLEASAIYRTTRFERLVRSAFIQELIGVSKVAEMLQISVEDATVETSKWLKPKGAPRYQ